MADSSLTEVIFPEGMISVGEWAFSKCRNLERVTFRGSYAPGMIKAGAFDGCTGLRMMEFAGKSSDTGYLLGAAVSALKSPGLIRMDDIGETSWFAKWDLSLKICLEADETEAGISAALCGEEDISYDGIGSIDGEMPGESGDFVKEAAIDKCLLCYLRLEHDEGLSDNFRKYICDYIKTHDFDSEDKYAWITLKEKAGDNTAYYILYLDVVCPDKETWGRMIEDLGSEHVAVKSFLIRKCSDASSALDDLFL